MAGIAMVLYGIVAMTIVVGTWMATRGSEPVFADAQALVALRAARRRGVLAIGAALIILALGLSTAALFPEWLGVGAAVAPALAGAGGLALYAATPPAQEQDSRTRHAASLQPRTPWNIAPRAALVGLGAALLVQISLLVFTGVTSSPDDQGHHRALTYTTDTFSSTTSPYPGWFYAGPLLACTVILAFATWLALRRIATTSSLPGESLEGLDELWRSTSARVVIGVSTAAVCFQLGGTSLFTGITLNLQFLSGAPLAWEVLSMSLTVLGFVALLLSVAALTRASLRAFSLPRNVVITETAAGGPA